MARLLRLFSVTCLALLFPLCLCAQDEEKIDSLETLLKTKLADTTKANVYVSLADAYRYRDPGKSRQYAQQAITFSRSCSHTSGLADGYNQYASTLANAGRFDEALIYYDSSATAWKRAGNTKREAKVYLSMSSTYTNTGNPSAALECAQRSLRIYDPLKDTFGIASCMLSMGNACFYQGDTLKALRYYQQTLDINRQSTDHNPGLSGSAINNIAGIYLQMNKYDSALVYYRKVLLIHLKSGEKSRIATTYSNIGSVAMALRHYDSALYYYRSSLAIHEEINNVMGIMNTMVGIGGAYIEMDQPDSALVYFRQALTLAKKTGAERNEMMVYGGMSKAYEAKKQPAEARKYKQLYDRLERELRSQ